MQKRAISPDLQRKFSIRDPRKNPSLRSRIQYRDDSARRGGPMMLVAAPNLPGPGLSPACAAYGASVLVLPDSSLDAVRVNASLCTQCEINAALLYVTVSVAGTHAALWVTRD